MQSSGAQIPRAAGVARGSALLSWAAATVLAQLFFAVALEAQVARLRVGTSGDYAPFSSTADGGDLEGLDIEIARQDRKSVV